ncbi:hypothetical protein An08g06290 [Aspergillus niger]|uniref:Uncharacterized protein n=2 Tax=Aspergillus niger TaxID=5061 RepID=A2QRJ8_ASPNC|nr:hypothetical protein An08g06290 [Aspergillus niger]CAK45599.1 hypothetical protein An08g06290 [Aspergillus niger]
MEISKADHVSALPMLQYVSYSGSRYRTGNSHGSFVLNNSHPGEIFTYLNETLEIRFPAEYILLPAIHVIYHDGNVERFSVAVASCSI